MFQQGNDLKHTAEVVRTRFENNNIKVMKSPRQSPDMNPIEKLRKLLKKRNRERRPKDLIEVKLYEKDEWANNPIKTCQAHVEKYYRRKKFLYIGFIRLVKSKIAFVISFMNNFVSL